LTVVALVIYIAYLVFRSADAYRCWIDSELKIWLQGASNGVLIVRSGGVLGGERTSYSLRHIPILMSGCGERICFRPKTEALEIGHKTDF